MLVTTSEVYLRVLLYSLCLQSDIFQHKRDLSQTQHFEHVLHRPHGNVGRMLVPCTRRAALALAGRRLEGQVQKSDILGAKMHALGEKS